MTAAPIDRPGGLPSWVRRRFGPDAVSGEWLAWGFRNESWRLKLASGADVVATRLTDAPLDPALLDRLRLGHDLVGRASIPSATLLEEWTTRDVVVTQYVDGRVGAEFLDAPSRANYVGRMAAEVLLGMGRVDARAYPCLPIERGVLDAISSASLRAPLEHVLSPSTFTWLVEHLAYLGRVWTPDLHVAAHGDLVPANLIGDGHVLLAVIDLESVRIAHPAADAAWFDWTIAFHHPSARASAWNGVHAGLGGQVDIGDVLTRRALVAARLAYEILLPGRGGGRRTSLLAQLEACRQLPMEPV